MKLLAIAFTVLSTGFFPSSRAQASASAGLEWSDVENYVMSHAVKADGLTVNLLHFEAVVGAKTWTVTGAQNAESQLVPDGPGLGWPAAGLVIEFSSSAEANTAASLILAVTGGTSAQSK
jgi:hypothetical protein